MVKTAKRKSPGPKKQPSRSKLYSYQKAGVRFMQTHSRVLLADEMGLGKTAQALSAQLGSNLTLIISTKGMKYFWQEEIVKWTRTSEKTIYMPQSSDEYPLGGGISVYYIVHWETLARRRPLPGEKEREKAEGNKKSKRPWNSWVQALAGIPWQTIIIDEAHKGKNRHAQRTEALWHICRQANPDRVFLLTGTPIVNQPADLWSLLKCLYPKKYTSYWRFFKQYVLAAPTPWDPWGGEIIGVRDPEGLREELAPIVLRRTKKTVMPSLPDKQYTLIPVELHPEQLRVYREIRDYMISEIDDQTTVRAPNVLTQIIRLRQAAIGLGAFAEGEEGWDKLPAAKIDALVDYIEGTDTKIVVATQFVWAALTVAKRLRQKKITAAVMYGATEEKERHRLVKQFQETEDPQVLVMTVQTGGEGWTLTAADTLIFLDRPWSPQVVKQAEDRLHRIGQKSTVHIVTLIARGTIEARVEEALKTKQVVFDSVFGKFKELL